MPVTGCLCPVLATSCLCCVLVQNTRYIAGTEYRQPATGTKQATNHRLWSQTTSPMHKPLATRHRQPGHRQQSDRKPARGDKAVCDQVRIQEFDAHLYNIVAAIRISSTR